MKAILILAGVGAVVAQNLAGQPACASGCLSSAITAAGCAPTDVACQCGPSQGAIGNAVIPCFLKSCSPADIISASSVGLSLCSVYSATAKQTGPTTTATTGSTSTSTTVATTSAPSSSTSTDISTLPGKTVISSTGTVSTPKPTTSNPPTSQSTNAAATPVILGAGAVAAFLGAVAAL